MGPRGPNWKTLYLTIPYLALNPSANNYAVNTNSIHSNKKSLLQLLRKQFADIVGKSLMFNYNNIPAYAELIIADSEKMLAKIGIFSIWLTNSGKKSEASACGKLPNID